MIDLRPRDAFAFADGVRISGRFQYTGGVKSRQNRACISLFRRSAKSHCTPFQGAPFKGRLLAAFCKHLGIRLIYYAVNHPQTNGKLERAFRDYMKDFYRRYDEWILAPLRKELPAYVYCRNHIRGHRALGGKPSIARLSEYDRLAPKELLDRLESFARCEVKRKVVPRDGYIPMFGRIAYVGRAWRERELTFVESLEGLEAHAEGRCVAVMRDYWKYRKLQTWEWRTIPPRLYCKPYEQVNCPRMAVAS